MTMTLTRSNGQLYAVQEFCTHRCGPLSEGAVCDNQITCPWHGSRFDLRTGAVVEGPAVFVQPRLEARVRDDRIEVGFPAAAGAELPELANLQLAPKPS